MTRFQVNRREQLAHLPIVLAIVALTVTIVGATLIVDRAATLIADRLLPEAHGEPAEMPGSPVPSVSVAPSDQSYLRASSQRRAMARHTGRK
jgi:hypothetical protein